METLDVLFVIVSLTLIVAAGIYIGYPKKVEKSTGDGPVLRPEDPNQDTPEPTSNIKN